MYISNLNSFKTLFQENYSEMVRIALFYVHDLAIAEDITQEVFTKLWEKREKLDTIDNLKGYISYAIKNGCLNYLEHQQVVNKYQQEYIQQIAEDDSTDEFIQKVQVSLTQLPPKRRKILELRVVDAKSSKKAYRSIPLKIISKKPMLFSAKKSIKKFRILFCFWP